jgi:hypothetical protein
MNRSTRHATCSRFVTWDQHPMHPTTKLHRILSVDSTARQRSFLVCHTTLPLMSGLLVAHCMSCTPERFYSQAARTIKCYDQSWTAGVNSRLRCSKEPNLLTYISMRWPTLEVWSKISLQERYVYFRYWYFKRRGFRAAFLPPFRRLPHLSRKRPKLTCLPFFLSTLEKLRK